MSGALTHSPARVLRQLLIDQGLGVAYSSATTAWAIRVNEGLKDVPDNAIFLQDTVGNKFAKRMDDGEVQENPGVQVIVRAGGATAEQTGNDKARTIMTTLDPLKLQTVTIDSSTYTVHNISRSGGVNALGTEEGKSMRYLFSLNLTVALRENS